MFDIDSVVQPTIAFASFNLDGHVAVEEKIRQVVARTPEGNSGRVGQVPKGSHDSLRVIVGIAYKLGTLHWLILNMFCDIFFQFFQF